MLSGEWWLLRQAQIPLTEQRIERNRIAWERSRSRRSRTSLQTCISMAELTDRAAKLCIRVNTLKLVSTLNITAATSVSRSAGNAVRQHERFDFPSSREWSLRLKLDLDRWTPDMLFKAAAVRGVSRPGPSMLDWGGCVTWLTVNRTEIKSGQMPLEFLLYAACAAAVMALYPLEDAQGSRFLFKQPAINEDEYHDWQHLAIRFLEDYVRLPSSMIADVDVATLKFMLFREKTLIFDRAAKCSRLVSQSLHEFGLLESPGN